MSNYDHHVAVLGASPKENRYSNKAIKLLIENGFYVTPIHPNFDEIENLKVIKKLTEIARPIDTLTLYINAKKIESELDKIVSIKPNRVIFNPGAESKLLQKELDKNKIEWIEGCTLVMLKTKSFLK
tara:strand:+ start:89 stop:469 length:381 start_codon:yes stop_codon:yes gene_type:complete